MQAQMSQDDHPRTSRYQFFILGLWQEPDSRPGRPAVWRISLEDPRIAQRSGFTNLADLDAFLAAWMEERVGSDR